MRDTRFGSALAKLEPAKTSVMRKRNESKANRVLVDALPEAGRKWSQINQAEAC